MGIWLYPTHPHLCLQCTYMIRIGNASITRCDFYTITLYSLFLTFESQRNGTFQVDEVGLKYRQRRVSVSVYYAHAAGSRAQPDVLVQNAGALYAAVMTMFHVHAASDRHNNVVSSCCHDGYKSQMHIYGTVRMTPNTLITW